MGPCSAPCLSHIKYRGGVYTPLRMQKPGRLGWSFRRNEAAEQGIA